MPLCFYQIQIIRHLRRDSVSSQPRNCSLVSPSSIFYGLKGRGRVQKSETFIGVEKHSAAVSKIPRTKTLRRWWKLTPNLQCIMMISNIYVKGDKGSRQFRKFCLRFPKGGRVKIWNFPNLSKIIRNHKIMKGQVMENWWPPCVVLTFYLWMLIIDVFSPEGGGGLISSSSPVRAFYQCSVLCIDNWSLR